MYLENERGALWRVRGEGGGAFLPIVQKGGGVCGLLYLQSALYARLNAIVGCDVHRSIPALMQVICARHACENGPYHGFVPALSTAHQAHQVPRGSIRPGGPRPVRSSSVRDQY